MKLDGWDWREFFIVDIGEIQSGKDIYHNERIIGDIPYISSTAKNNGIGHFVSNINKTLEKNCLSVNRNGSVGYSFYHPYNGLYSNDCRKIQLKYKSKFIGFFIANQITKQKNKYNYGYKMGTGRLKRQKILLPTNNKKEPDYKYMEEYSKSIFEKKQEKYTNYIKKVLTKLEYREIVSLKEKEWREFFIVDVFDTIQRGKRLTKANQIEGNIPYVSSTSSNNGIDNFIGNDVGVRIFSNCLSIANSGSVGSSFYHPYRFVASDHITHLQKDDMSEFIYQFISTLTNRFSKKYNFNREINDARISREKILLPINDKNEIAYEYMEQYMKNIQYKKIKQYLDF